MHATLTRRRGKIAYQPGSQVKESGPMVFKGISNLVPLADLTLHTDPLTIRNDQRADIVRECERGWTVQRIADTVILPDRLVVRHLKAMGWPVVGKPRAKGATTTAPKPGTNASKNGRGSCVAKILAYIQAHTSATVSELRGRTGINEDHIRTTLKLHPELFREVDRISVNNAKTAVWGLVGGAK